MEQNDLRELYIDELRDVYDAEKQLVKALPDMAEAATSDKLRGGFEEHLEQTRVHVQRIEQILSEMDEEVKGKKCKGMKGLISEGKDMMDEDLNEEALDAGLISAAQRVEHYEIAAYGTLKTYATILGEQEAVALLEQTLEEEKQTDQKLTTLAQSINVQAVQGAGSNTGGAGLLTEEDEDEEVSSNRRGKAAGI